MTKLCKCNHASGYHRMNSYIKPQICLITGCFCRQFKLKEIIDEEIEIIKNRIEERLDKLEKKE